jgi:hydroxyacyl-ACP dehydratase HTD2-like protein with hotdog domain
MDDAIAAVEAARGRELASYRWRVEEGQVRQFERATGVERQPGATPGEVPVCFTVTTGLWGVSHQDLLAGVGLDLRRVVHGEQRFEVDEPLRLGEEYTVRHRLAEVEVKTGRRGGRMLFVGVETTVEDAAGALRVRELHTSIQTER